MLSYTRLFLFFVFISFISIAKSQDHKIYSKDDITFKYPGHWVVRDFPKYYILISEPPQDQLSVMTTFDVEVIDTIYSLKKFCKNYEKKIKSNPFFKNVEIVFKIDFNYKGYDAIQYNCIAIVQNIPSEWESLVFVKDKKVYKLSMTSSLGKLDEIREETKIIWNSFTL